MIENEFTKSFDLRFPLVQAPMFLASSPELAIATCQAGGLGTIPAHNYRSLHELRSALKKISSVSPTSFGVNLISPQSNPKFEEQLNICLEEKVPLIISSLGNPARLMELVKGSETKVYADVVNIKHAKKAVDAGVHGLVAVCAGAGGHAGEASPFSLIPELRKNFSLPILAAGAIIDGRTMFSAMSLGAQGVYMGTRFLASQEAPVSERYKEAIVESRLDDIVNTDRVDGYPGNFIKNQEYLQTVREASLFEKLLGHSQKMDRAMRKIRAAKVLFSAQRKSKASYKTVFSAGHGVGGVDEILSVSQIFEKVQSEFEQSLKNPFFN